jgi:hypothetical protein
MGIFKITTVIGWDNSIPGISETHTSGHRDTMMLCWSPTLADLNNNPHCFIATASDDNCPYLGITKSNFCITVDTSGGCFTAGIALAEKINSLIIYPQPAQ